MAALGTFLATFAVAGLTAVRTALVSFARGIGSALRTLTVTAPLKGLTTGARAAMSAMRGLVGMTKTLATTLTGIGGLGAVGLGILGAGNLKSAISDSADYIAELNKVANTLSVPIEEMSAFSNYAEKLGFSLDDSRQALTQFYGVAGEAAKGGNGTTEAFKLIGMDMTDLKYKTMPVIDLLEEFAGKLKNVQGMARTNLLSSIFGDDDATKVGVLLDKMAKSPRKGPERVWFQGISNEDWDNGMRYATYVDEYEQQQQRMAAAGAIIGDHDVQLQQRYKAALEDLRMTLRGLQLTMFRTFGPTFIRMMKAAADYLILNRKVIVNRLIGAWNALAYAIHDFRVVFLGLQSPIAVTNSWLAKLRQGLTLAGVVLLAFGIAAAVIFKALDNVLAKLTGRNLSQWLKAISVDVNGFATMLSDAIIKAASVIADFIYVVSFQDGKLTTITGLQMSEWRDTIIEYAIMTWEKVVVIVGQAVEWIKVHFASLLYIWNQVSAGFLSGDFAAATSAWYVYAAAVGVTVRWFLELIKQLVNVFALNQQATGSFAWINSAKDWITALIHNLQTAIGWFQSTFGWVQDLFEAMNWDFGGTLMVLALLKLSGILGALSTFITTLITVLVSGLAPALLPIIASTLGWAAAFAAVLLAAKALADFIQATNFLWINSGIRGITDKIHGVDAAMDQSAASNASYVQYGRKPGMARPPVAPMPVVDPMYNYGEIMRPAPARQAPVDININVPGMARPMRVSAQQSEIDLARNSRQLSVGGR